MNRFPPGPRPRTPSGHDIPIPEAVFTAMYGIQVAVSELAAEVSAGKADTDVKLAEVKDLALKASAQSVERWTNLAKALVPAVIAIVGGTVGVQKLTAPEPQLTTVVSQSALAVELDACMTLPESNQRPCQDAAYDRDRARKVSRQRP